MNYKLFNSGNKISSQLGRSMVEMVGVLAIVGLLGIGGIAGYVKGSHQLRTNKLKDDISHLVANIRTVFLTQNNYQALSERMAIGTGIVPEDMISTDKQNIINRHKGSVFIKSAETIDDVNGAFIIIFNGLDSLTCQELLLENWGSDIQTGFIGMTIKSDGDLTIETSSLVPHDFTSSEVTFRATDLQQNNVQRNYNVCNCGTANLCAIAWKFI